ncbi:low-density lipoprotein receptor-related protein 1B-like [Bolinopsis microptera]|uniref:low-density lipoprotein receptor-related protein 1B-like n=1 Tax=Bolinopsis microptera TaxID=2820187 RepID=UPI003079D5F8
MACKNRCNMRKYLPVQQICDGSSDCADGVDETNCESDDPAVASCVHFQQKQDLNVQNIVVIHESVRCAIFDMGRSPALYPYCADFMDQTNCTHVSRVGGYCEVNGFQSTISKIMICGGNKQLCDDNSENNCIYASSKCRVHKHRLCDGEQDCPDGSDENHDDCNSMTKDQTCVRKFGINEKNMILPHSWIMDNEPDCLDGLDEMENRWDDCLGSRSKDKYDSSVSCNDECDTNDCKDESDCNNRSYGMVCKTRCNMKTYLPVQSICNGFSDCSDGLDEENCELDESAVPSCVHFEQKEEKSLEKVVPISNRTRCAIFNLSARPPVYPYCTYFEDQTNCSDTNRVGGYCEVKGFQSTISKTMVCGGNKQLCDDNSENNCIDASSNCRVHKHRLCDGEKDCPDGSDETLDICNSEPQNVTCVRKFGIPGKSTTIPGSWVNDNELDCLDGLDEDMWNQAEQSYSCGTETYRSRAGRVNKCRNSFVCPGVDNKNSVTIELFCDSKESCEGRENEVCETSKDFFSTKRIIEKSHKSVKDLCGKTNTSVCQENEFDYHTVDIFGVERTKLYLPSEPIDCSDKFGEHYVYLSCMGRCDNTSCPLKSDALKQDSCPEQYSERIYTLANNSYLTFVTKSEGRYHNDYYECDNGRCVNFSQVCDLVNDCGDMSDERNCKNHFTCEDDDKVLLGFEQKCDGVYDCHDLSDECNDFCGKLIISDLMLTRLCWSIGTIAILLSCRTLVSVLQGMKQSIKYENILYTKVLLMLVIMGNLLMAVYVITLSIYDIMYGAELCREQAHWLTSAKCSALGIVSTIGTELSIFSLTFLTILRLYNVSNRSAIVPVTRSSVSKITLWTAMIIVAAVVVALIPLTPGESFENYFTQGYFYEEDYKLFTGFNSKVKHVNILEKYYSTGNSSANVTTDMSWKEISALVEGMFTNDYGNLTVNRVHFYGNDKICLFKYILRPEETMVYQQGNVLTWIVLTLNSACFLVMLIAVVWICIVREQSSKKGDPKNSEHDRTRYFERLILVIVLSDFVCWTPFAIICILHNLNIADVSSWYNIMSLTLLPLNSVLNPLICLIKMGVKKLFNQTLQETFQRFPGVKKGEPRQGKCNCKGSCNCNIEMNSVAPVPQRVGLFANPTWIPLATDIEPDTTATEHDIEPDTTV